jgi:hypothetical protein
MEGAETAARPGARVRAEQGESARRGEQPPLVRSARRVTRSVLIHSGLPTYWARMLPGFLIVGAQRCGTTSLTRTLSRHPAVFSPVVQGEVHYFDISYQRGIAWYRSHFPLLARARRAARGAAAPPVTFESSPYYMFHPLAPERINRDLPGVKVLVLLRDPVERTYSAHTHESELGFETEPYERALELESSRLEGEAERIMADPTYYSHSHQHHAYRTRGQYIEQIERMEQIFGRERMHVVDSGDFFMDPEPVYRGVLEFLRLPGDSRAEFKRQNARPRSSPMPESVRDELDRHYRPYDDRLAAWLGREPSWRRPQ